MELQRLMQRLPVIVVLGLSAAVYPILKISGQNLSTTAQKTPEIQKSFSQFRRGG
jgi:hypothetical protein